MKGVTFLIEKLVTTTYKKLGINSLRFLPAFSIQIITDRIIILRQITR